MTEVSVKNESSPVLSYSSCEIHVLRFVSAEDRMVILGNRDVKIVCEMK